VEAPKPTGPPKRLLVVVRPRRSDTRMNPIRRAAVCLHGGVVFGGVLVHYFFLRTPAGWSGRPLVGHVFGRFERRHSVSWHQRKMPAPLRLIFVTIADCVTAATPPHPANKQEKKKKFGWRFGLTNSGHLRLGI